jgi:hypothetical protein
MSKKNPEQREMPRLVNHLGAERWGVRVTGNTWYGMKLTRWAYFDTKAEAHAFYNDHLPRSMKGDQ